MDHEPHYHLALHNDYVKVFKVEVASGDSIVLHSHDADTIAMAYASQPLLESNETRALLVRVLPHQSMNLENSPAPQVIVALDPP